MGGGQEGGSGRSRFMTTCAKTHLFAQQIEHVGLIEHLPGVKHLQPARKSGLVNSNNSSYHVKIRTADYIFYSIYCIIYSNYIV